MPTWLSGQILVRIARILAKGEFPTLEALGRLSAEQAKAKLRELPGVGDYSADIITPHCSFPIDVWSADVFGKLFSPEVSPRISFQSIGNSSMAGSKSSTMPRNSRVKRALAFHCPVPTNRRPGDHLPWPGEDRQADSRGRHHREVVSSAASVPPLTKKKRQD